jgi:hypothetical protein
MSETGPVNLELASGAMTRGFRRLRLAKMIALAAIIFAGGGATGWGVAIFFHPPPPMPMAPPAPPVNEMVNRLRDELLLSDDQVKRVEEIYSQRNEALQAIRRQMGPQLKSQYDELNRQMKEVLNPAQFRRWHERFENVREEMLPPPRRGFNPPGGPPGGNPGPPPGLGPPGGMPPGPDR